MFLSQTPPLKNSWSSHSCTRILSTDPSAAASFLSSGHGARQVVRRARMRPAPPPASTRARRHAGQVPVVFLRRVPAQRRRLSHRVRSLLPHPPPPPPELPSQIGLAPRFSVLGSREIRIVFPNIFWGFILQFLLLRLRVVDRRLRSSAGVD